MSDVVVVDVALTQLAIPLAEDTVRAAVLAHPGYYGIQNRRFLGNKYKLLSFIKDIVDQEIGSYQSVCDIFAGTGVVGAAFNSRGIKVISNDILFSSYASLKCFLGPHNLNFDKLCEKINYLNSLRARPNYFSDNFSETYFTYENASLVGTIREEIEKVAFDENEKFALISSLIYAVDKVANTVGHYDAFRKKMTSTQKVKLKYPKILTSENRNNEIYNEDANSLIRKIKADILYLDPPYNSRQYSDTYHLLENLTHWHKPELHGVAKKMDRSHIKSRYSLKSAAETLRDLIDNADVKNILVSYNNTGDTKHGRSNSRITDEEMVKILESKGKVKVFEKNYKAFSSGKSSSEGNVERIFYCKVNK